MTAAVRAAGPQAQRADFRMRSFAPPASGRVAVEASEGGGRGRLTALSLPDPQTVAPGTRTYVVWAVSEGRIRLLGELRRDERGNGGLAFERPEGFARYSVVVTAEANPTPERPGSPVLSTRAGEVSTLYLSVVRNEPPPAVTQPPRAEPAVTPPPDTPAATPDRTTASEHASPPASRRRLATPRAPGYGFFGEVDGALEAAGGGRLVALDGDQFAPAARGEARTATRSGQAYVRADFSNVPLPSAVGADVFVLWAILADGRIIYMGSLPVGEALNLTETYVRTAGFDTDDFTLFVTAERQRPVPSPSGRRILSQKTARHFVK